jgi:hypothetical protein
VLAVLQRRGLRLAGVPDNLIEAISAGDNVTYWASAAKATKELGFNARPLYRGVADTWGQPKPD